MPHLKVFIKKFIINTYIKYIKIIFIDIKLVYILPDKNNDIIF